MAWKQVLQFLCHRTFSRGYLALMASSQLVEHNLQDKIKDVLTFNGLGLSSQTIVGVLLDVDDIINLKEFKMLLKTTTQVMI